MGSKNKSKDKGSKAKPEATTDDKKVCWQRVLQKREAPVDEVPIFHLTCWSTVLSSLKNSFFAIFLAQIKKGQGGRC
jgi:hypothetical protein